jgi:O-antigen/teichoic acid export membrane protein
MTGTALAQGLTILFAPIITRLYNPTDFGIMAVFTSLITWLSVVNSWGYELAIMLPRNEREASDLCLLSILISIAMAASILVLTLLFDNLIARLFPSLITRPWIYYLSPAFLMAGFLQTTSVLYSRYEAFKKVSGSKVATTGAMVGYQVGTGYFMGSNPGGLIYGFLAGQFIGCLVLAWRIPLGWANFIRKGIFQELLYLSKRYKDFPLFSSWASLLNVGTYKLPVLLMAVLFDSRVAGIITLAITVISVPISLISGSLSRVFFQKAAEQTRMKGDVGPLIRGIITRLFLFAIIPSFLLIAFARPLFELFFGELWSESGLFVQILTPLYLAMFVIAPVSTIFFVMEKQSLCLLWQLVYFLVSLFSFIIGWVVGSYVLGVILFSCLGTLRYFGMLLSIFKMARIGLKDLFKKGETV